MSPSEACHGAGRGRRVRGLARELWCLSRPPSQQSPGLAPGVMCEIRAPWQLRGHGVLGGPGSGSRGERGATLLSWTPLEAAGTPRGCLPGTCSLLAHLSTLTAQRLLPALFRNRCWASWGAGECGALGRSGCWGHPQCFGTLKTDCVLVCDLLQGPYLGRALCSSFWGIPIPCWGAGSGSGNGAGELLPGDTSLCSAVLVGERWVLWVREDLCLSLVPLVRSWLCLQGRGFKSLLGTGAGFGWCWRSGAVPGPILSTGCLSRIGTVAGAAPLPR